MVIGIGRTGRRPLTVKDYVMGTLGGQYSDSQTLESVRDKLLQALKINAY